MIPGRGPAATGTAADPGQDAAQGQATATTASPAQIAAAADTLARGELAAFPTETVYGLGADAEQPDAVARIYAAKGRPSNHPVIVHLAPDGDPEYWSGPVGGMARTLIDAFWPGPLTLILPRAAHIEAAVSGGQDSIGLRCPSHPVAQALLREFAARKASGQGGVAAPSANRFGHVSPTRAEHVRSEFAELVAAGMPVLDGGAAEVGIESTILDVSRLASVGAVLLRPGHVTAARIAEVIGVLPSLPDAAAPRVSGSLKAHYAPRTPLRLAGPEQLRRLAVDGAAAQTPVVLVSHSMARAPAALPPGVVWHAADADPLVYARELYDLLRRLDTQGYALIVLETLPDDAGWTALRDRVGRAAAAFVTGE